MGRGEVMDIYYCPAVTYRQTRETPAETCENEVPDAGDFCPLHEDDRDDAAYDDWKESRYDD